MKKIISKIVSLVTVVAMGLCFGLTVNAASTITVKINGNEYSAATFEECVNAAGFAGIVKNNITSLELVSGTISLNDWTYILTQSGGGYGDKIADSLESLVISNDVVLTAYSGSKNELVTGAFQYDEALKTVHTGSAQIIRDFAFLGCSSLTEVTAPNVEAFSPDAFEDCTSLTKLNLPATPPTAGVSTNTPSNKKLGFVSKDGTALKGKALEDAISAYQAVNDGNTTDQLWYGWQLPSTDIVAPDTSKDSTVNLQGTTIPVPTYTITIPEKIEFGEITKKVKSTTDMEAIAKTPESIVSVVYSYLFDNQKHISVTLSTDNKLSSNDSELAFKVYEKGASNNLELTNGTKVFTIKPTSQDLNAKEEKTIFATVDQRLIKASGDYTGVITFIIAIADNE